MGGNNLITFSIDNTEYQAEEGMTWEEWVNSEYNTDGFTKFLSTYLGRHVIVINMYYVYNINITDVIQSNDYILNIIPNSGGSSD